MKTLPLAEAKATLSRLVDCVEKTDEEVLITRNGRPVAILVSPDEYESWKETRAIQSDRALMREIRRGRAQEGRQAVHVRAAVSRALTSSAIASALRALWPRSSVACIQDCSAR